MHPSKLINLLAVPGTDEPLSLFTLATAGGEPYNGWLEDKKGRVWARLEAFRFNFVKFQAVTAAERDRLASEGPQEVRVPVNSFTSSLSDRCTWVGHTIELEGYLKGFEGDDLDAVMSFESAASSVELLFLAHGWSGVAAIEINGVLVKQIDLFNRENNIVRRYKVNNPEKETLLFRVHPVGQNPESQGRELLIDGIVEYFEDMVVPQYSKEAERNRGGAFRDRFFEIADTLSDDAVIVDVGGGRRQLADKRYINLEYSLFEEPDLFGDALALPFKSDSIDFIYTAAVLEHVRDPLKMGQEIHRVLKPGAKVLANSAFMQPVHSEGQHFFNLTPYGIDLTFGMFENRRVWWDTDFATTIRWFLDVSELRKSVSSKKIDEFITLANEFSPQISEERGMYLAQCVWLEATK